MFLKACLKAILFSPLALNVVLSAPVRAMTLQERAEAFSQAAISWMIEPLWRQLPHKQDAFF